MKTFTLGSVPSPLEWRHEPAHWAAEGSSGLVITSPPRTDLFTDPGTGVKSDSAPAALFVPAQGEFRLSARVEVEFAATYDAGVLHVWRNEEEWAKLCFEYSPQGEPTIVSVVTRGVSDDCNSVPVAGRSVFLRTSQFPRATAFHWSADGLRWSLVRYFSVGAAAGLRVGFSSQSPTGGGCRAVFSDIRFQSGAPPDLRNGD